MHHHQAVALEKLLSDEALLSFLTPLHSLLARRALA